MSEPIVVENVAFTPDLFGRTVKSGADTAEVIGVKVVKGRVHLILIMMGGKYREIEAQKVIFRKR